MDKIVLLIAFFLLATFFHLPAYAEEDTVPSAPQYRIEILVHSRELVFFENNDPKRFSVATSRSDNLVPIEEDGGAEEIIINPPWNPTSNVRKRYFKKHGKELPKYISPAAKGNALGRLAIKLSFIVSEGQVLKIHDTDEPTSIGKRESSGCTRMLYKNIEEIIIALLSSSQGISKEIAQKFVRDAVASKKTVRIKLKKDFVRVTYKAS
jgi:hypothetical protein